MKMLSRKLLYAVPAVMIGGAALVGGLVWASDHSPNWPPRPHPPPPKLLVSEQPVHRDTRLATSFAPLVKSATDAVRLTEHPKNKVTLLRLWSGGGARYVVVEEGRDKAG
jgi:hypothetical protein